jgi:hypothetical protein
MPVPLSATSARRFAARQFADELVRAMTVRKVGRRRLGDLIGAPSASIIAYWRTGAGLPRLDSARRMAEALEWPRLLEIVQQVREGRCAFSGCGRAFTNEGGGPKRYCSDRCRDAAAKIRAMGPSTRQRADLSERRLAEHQVAVEAFCRRCEPDGHCRDARCQLRPVSPLPLLTVKLPGDIATPAPGP